MKQLLIPVPDWKLLRQQKEAMLALTKMLHVGKGTHEGNPHIKAFDGLIHFIDSIQDAAIAQGATELEVFGNLKSEE